MLAHLVDIAIRSLVLASIAACILWILRTRRTAALQHAIWTAVICGMLSLFLLGSALPKLPLRILADAPPPIQPTQPVRLAVPLFIGESVASVPALPPPTSRATFDWTRITIFAYAAIAFGFLARFAIGMLLVRRLIANSTPVAEFRESESIAVPVTVGWLRPKIVLPLAWREWDRVKLDAVLEHEGAHARRRDGLAAALAGVNRCLFWFHPLAWWLERRLALLAELACDESCVAAIGDREGYAQLLLEMAQVVDGSHGRLRQHALTMAASSHIRRRIDSILEEGRTFSRGMSRTGRAVVALCGISTVLAAGTVTLDREQGRETPTPLRLPLNWPPFTTLPPPPPPSTLLAQAPSTATASTPRTNTVRPKFEVASIRPAASAPPMPRPAGGDGVIALLPPPPPPSGSGVACNRRFVMDAGRVDLSCVSLQDLLLTDVFSIHGSKLVGPDWLVQVMDAQRFDISAKLPEGASADQLPGMFQTLLEERFGLTFHREYKEQAVYTLVVSKSGLKLKPAAPESDQPAWVATAAAVEGPYGNGNIGGIRFRSIPMPNSDGGPINVWQSPDMGFVRRSNTGGLRGIVHYEAPSMTFEGLANLAVIAGNALEPAVVDMTGLKGRYQVNLDISMADLMAFLTSPGVKDAAAVQEAQVNMLQEALKKLGLQLESRKAPVETIVIDHLEKTPTAN
jgi:uncharacterized protein (TIGR03435 family)